MAEAYFITISKIAQNRRQPVGPGQQGGLRLDVVSSRVSVNCFLLKQN